MPGGIGALDGGLTAALVLYGADPASAAAAVLAYHAIVLWIPTLLGTIAFLRLRPTSTSRSCSAPSARRTCGGRPSSWSWSGPRSAGPDR